MANPAGPATVDRRSDTTLPYLASLNPEQREAVLHTGNDGGRSLLILAGAGSGKTRVITTKIAYLIRERGLDPRSILAVTFTNRAAREMADRARQIDERAEDAMLRTFHSFGAWFLRRNGSLGGLSSNFVIYDDDDTVSLLSSIMEDIPRAEVKQAAYAIARAKDFFLSPEDPELDRIDHRKKFRKIYARYEERLAQIGNVDFGDLIKKPVEILRSQPEVARRFRERFRVIMVDEYQDSNIAQFELLKELCGPDTYVCVVGDDDQSIYRFRGAEVRNILEFPDRFPGTDIVRLERNYRSTAPILQVASSVVDHNEGRLGKTLRSERGGGKTPTLVFLPDQDEEAEFCAELIEKTVRGGRKGQAAGKDVRDKRAAAKPSRALEQPKAVYSDWAILYRTNAQSRGFETEFLRRRIPYRVVGSLKFYEREEIKDALALLSFLVNSRDEVAFRRVVNKPIRGVGAATVDKVIEAAGFGLADMAADDGIEAGPSPGDIAAAARRIMPDLPAKARGGLAAFLAAIDAGAEALEADPARNGAREEEDAGPIPDRKRVAKPTPKTKTKPRDGLRAGEGLSVCVVTLINEAELDDYHRSHDEITGKQRIENLQELVNSATDYPATREGLLEFLEHIELDRSLETAGEGQGNSDDVVTLITLHNTKGLEFRRVIITGIEQGIFPRDDKKGDDLEEERRLFYVGATRAMDELYLCSCAMRLMFGRIMPSEPSIFLREVDKSSLRILGKAPYGFNSGNARSASGGSDEGSVADSVVEFGRYPGGASRSSGRAGRAFAGHAPAKKVTSSDGRWQIGDRIFHDDHGYGAVIEIREPPAQLPPESDEDGPVVRVRFDTGKELRFLSSHQSSRFTKIGDD
ncbi:DNA helicase [Spirochaetia bacterium]|nr:DNA helicase [Spirochaetia bacterium]